MELPGQMRKPRFREEQHRLSDDSIQKEDDAGPGVRMGPRPGSTQGQMQAEASAGSWGRVLIIYKAASQQASAFLQPGLAQLMNSQPWENSLRPLFIKPGMKG